MLVCLIVTGAVISFSFFGYKRLEPGITNLMVLAAFPEACSP